MEIDQSELMVGFRQVWIKFERAAEFRNRAFVRKSIMMGPQDRAAGQICHWQVGIELEGLIDFLERLEFESRILWLQEEHLVRILSCQQGMDCSETGISGYGLLKQIDSRRHVLRGYC